MAAEDGMANAQREQKTESSVVDLTAARGLAPSNVHSLEKQRTMPVEVQKLLRQSRVEQQEKESMPIRGTRSKGEEPFVARNWKELTAKELAAMPRVAQSRYQAYDPPPKAAQEAKEASQARVRARCTQQRELHAPPSLEQRIEKEHDNHLLGQLKAAEARQRLREHRQFYSALRTAEIKQLIASQDTALDALRLKSFLPPTERTVTLPKYLNKQQRQRCEKLLEDDKGSAIQRRP